MRIIVVGVLLVLPPVIASGQVRPCTFPMPAWRTDGGTPQGPTQCTIIYDGELGQAERLLVTNAVACYSARSPEGLIADLLAVDDFDANRSGWITDTYLYIAMLPPFRSPVDGVRIYLWGGGASPNEKPTGAWDIPPHQIDFRSLGWWTGDGFEIRVRDLEIPFTAGRNWITIQPRDWSSSANTYHLLRNYNRPLQGDDAYVKDGPDAEVPVYGFTDWRTAESQGFQAADSFIRLEGCFDPMIIAVEGECGGTAQFSWSNASPESTLTFLYAKQTGNVRIPPNLPCGGTQLGLGWQRLQVAFSVETGEGLGTVERFLPAAACPGHFQALIREPTGPCEVSNVVGTP